MRLQSTPYNNLFNEVANNLAQRTGISNFGADSKAFSLLSTFITENKNLVDNTNQLMSSLHLQEAIGDDLDSIGEMVGVQRQKATKAYSNAVDKSVQFFVETGTFGDINDGSSISIPVGTLIFLEEKDSSSGKRIEYRVTTATTLAFGESVHYMSVQAIESGSKSNVSALGLSKHNFTDYTLSSQNKLKVRNNFAIVNGVEKQTDQSYRFSISKAWTAQSIANETSLKIAALSVPGVKEAKIFSWYNGIGTTGLVIDVFEGRTPSSLLSLVSSRASLFTSAGEIVNVYTPKYVALELELIVKTKSEMTSLEKTKLTNQIVSFTKAYINKFRIGQSFSLESYLSSITRLSNSIIRIGKKQGENNAELFAVYFIDSLGQYSKKSIKTAEVTINQDQKVILLDTVATPVRITIEKV